MRRRAAALAAIAAPGPAHAHAAIVGVGGFAGGALHPLLVPSHALALAALALLIARQDRTLPPLAAFAAGLLIGIHLVTAAVAVPGAEIAVLMLAAACALLAAFGRGLPLAVTVPVAAAAGLALLLDSVPAVVSPAETLKSLAGTALSASAALAGATFAAARLRRGWQIAGLRILGSWIAASAILALVLRLVR